MVEILVKGVNTRLYVNHETRMQGERQMFKGERC